MRQFWRLGALFTLGLASLTLGGCEGQRSLTRARTKKVERGLLRAVYIKGTVPEKLTLAGRMAFYKVPGVSLAVIDRYGIDWAKSYGTQDPATLAPVTPETVFQVGALTRPVFAAALLSYAERGKLALGGPAALRELMLRSLGTAGPAAPGCRSSVPRLKRNENRWFEPSA